MKLLGETLKSTKKTSKTPKLQNSPTKSVNNNDEERRREAKNEKENFTRKCDNVVKN